MLGVVVNVVASTMAGLGFAGSEPAAIVAEDFLAVVVVLADAGVVSGIAGRRGIFVSILVTSEKPLLVDHSSALRLR